MYASWVEISKSNLLHNLAQYKKLVGKTAEVMPIIKSNAYGHGMVEVAKIISPKTNWIGVASLGEALELRRAGIKKNIFVLAYSHQDLLKEGIKKGVALPVYDLKYAQELSKIARGLKKNVKVHVKIDTGTSRIGVMPKDAVKFIRQIISLPYIQLDGIWSHFAASEEDPKFTVEQLRIFRDVLKKLNDAGITAPYYHFACTAATISIPDSRYNLARLGIGLYGLWPSESTKKIAQKKISLKPVMTWKSRVIQVKELSKGTKVSYGCTYTAKKKMKMAVVAAGYWEGYDRKLSNSGEVLIGGERCPIIGRICMNIMMVDVSKVKSVKGGTEVVLLGRQKDEEVTAEEIADKVGTINYEVVTKVNPLLERKIVE